MKKFISAVVLIGLFDGAAQAGPLQRIAANIQERRAERQERRQRVVQAVQEAAPMRTFVAGAVGRLPTCAGGVCR